jgi:hypothetical protein
MVGMPNDLPVACHGTVAASVATSSELAKNGHLAVNRARPFVARVVLNKMRTCLAAIPGILPDGTHPGAGTDATSERAVGDPSPSGHVAVDRARLLLARFDERAVASTLGAAACGINLDAAISGRCTTTTSFGARSRVTEIFPFAVYGATSAGAIAFVHGRATFFAAVLSVLLNVPEPELGTSAARG